MSCRGRTVSTHHREYLTRGWEMCATGPDNILEPASLVTAAIDWISMSRPTTAAATLRDAGLWNLDSEPRRFDAQDWWFRTHFTASTHRRNAFLGFDGIATIAEVWLNGQSILVSDSMFISHEIDVSDLLQTDNELIIRCKSLDKQLAAKRPRPRWKSPMIENQQLRWFRTTLLGRTPGWSPPAAAVGPWKDVWLEERSDVLVRSLSLVSNVRDAHGVLTVDCTLAALDSAHIESVEMCATRGNRSWTTLLEHVDADQFSGTVVIENVDLWWPHTHGEPALHDVSLTIRFQDQRVPAHVALAPAGFRTIAIDRSTDGFGVSVNGARIFCRGACWMPLDVVTLGASREQYRSAVQQTRDAGMNMLRVTGTTIYESDEFLNLCDREGILLWQDLMFANMDFPADDPNFSRLVELEVHQQLDRLHARPCLAVICGNSEVEQQAAMWGASRDRWSPSLFHERLPQLAQQHCTGVPYWPSSAHGGAFPHQVSSGTTSYYGVGAYLRPLDDARRSELRFATECLAFANIPDNDGIAAMPGGLGLKVHHPQWKSRTPRDLGAGWDFEDVRDFYLKALFDIDGQRLRYADHDRYLELSRVVTGEAMLAAFSEWRRKRSACDGALVWFMRDLWAGAGWGIVDAGGQPKAPYYYLRRALQPVALLINDEGLNGLSIHTVNEKTASFAGTIEVTSYRDSVVVGSGSATVVIEPHGCHEWNVMSLFDSYHDFSYAHRFGPPAHTLLVARLYRAAGELVTEAFYFPLGLKMAQPREVRMRAQVRVHSDTEVFLTIIAEEFAQSIAISVSGFMPDDQFFHLAPQSTRTIRLQRTQSGKAPAGFVKALNAIAAVKIELPE